MEQQKQQQKQDQRPPPPAYTQHTPESLHLPSVPTHAPSSNSHIDRLPGLRSLDLLDAASPRFAPSPVLRFEELSPKSTQSQWADLPPLNSATFPRVPDGIPGSRPTMEPEVGSPMDTGSVASVQDDALRRREMRVWSVEDPDVRLAAEALSGLGNPDFVCSPTSRSLTIPRDRTHPTTTDPEPLLSLITSNHPWLGGTIHGSISAYNATKGYSPRFVKYGAELIERNIGSPVVNTVSSVGRRTGVEKNLRRYLGEIHRRPSDLEQGDASSDSARKRQRIMSPSASATEAMDLDDAFSPSRTRGGSQSSYAETLPAYDDHWSPRYEEHMDGDTASVIDPAFGKETDAQSGSAQDRRPNWSTQLIMTTSGLGVALSDASLRSLKLCLGLLRSATKHIDSVMLALKQVLSEYESALQNRHNEDSSDVVSTQHNSERSKEEQVRIIADRIKSLSSDIWTTLQKVVQSVSHYTGGALPQNASQVVRTQLLSVPQRWQSASRASAAAAGENNAGAEEVRGANRMLAFAKEGLEMMGQITAVVDGTVQSAESWLGRMGRGASQGQESEQAEKMALPAPVGANGLEKQ